MHLTLSHELLLKATDLVAKVADKHHRFAILGNIKLELSQETLTLTASDLEVELTTTVRLPEGACLQGGSLTLPAGKFHEICKSLPKGGMVSLTSQDDKCVIESGKSRFSLSGLPAADFPSIGLPRPSQSITVVRSELLDKIHRTKFCMASQDVRHYLTGMLFHIDQNILTLVATDGHRLATSSTQLQSQHQETQIIVPGKAVVELERLFGELGKSLTDTDTIELGFDGEFLQVFLNFAKGDDDKPADEIVVVMTARLIEGKFPDYKRVLPTGCDKFAYFDKEAIMNVLRRVAILTNEKSRGVIFEFSEQNAIVRSSASTSESDEAMESLDLRYEGLPIEISLNETYLKGVFGVLSGELCLAMSQPNGPTLITQTGNDDYRYVVMPMRI